MNDSGSMSISRLIQAARANNADAAAELFRQYRNYLKMIARLLLDKAATIRTDPSDLAQEALLRAHKRFQ